MFRCVPALGNSRCVPALGNSRCVPALGNSRRSLHFVPLCTRTEHSLLAVFTLLTAARTVLFPAAFIQIAAKKTSLRVQSERSERLRELTPAARRSRSLLFGRSGFAKCGMWKVECGIVVTLRFAPPAARRRFVPRGFSYDRGLQSFLTGAE